MPRKTSTPRQNTAAPVEYDPNALCPTIRLDGQVPLAPSHPPLQPAAAAGIAAPPTMPPIFLRRLARWPLSRLARGPFLSRLARGPLSRLARGRLSCVPTGRLWYWTVSCFGRKRGEPFGANKPQRRLPRRLAAAWMPCPSLRRRPPPTEATAGRAMQRPCRRLPPGPHRAAAGAANSGLFLRPSDPSSGGRRHLDCFTDGPDRH
jgi:hypothetical protein